MAKKKACEACGSKVEGHTGLLLWHSLPVTPEIIEEESWRKIPPWEWKCDYVKCNWGMGLAGADRCSGNPRMKDCPEFETYQQWVERCWPEQASQIRRKS